MSRVVTIDLNVDDAQAVRAWQRGKQAIAEFDKQGGKAKQTFGGMFAATTRSIAGAAAGFAGVGSVLGGILLAANQLRAEWDNITSRQAAAAQANLTFEQSLAQAVRNASGIFEAADVRQRSLDLAQDANISPAKAAGIIGSAVTSTGVTNAQEADTAIAAARASAIYAPDLDNAGTEALAGVAASGAKRFGVSPEAYIGYLQQVAGQSNVRELTPLIENVAPVVSNLSEFGFDAPGAGSLVSTLTQGIGDTTGETSGTAALNFAKALRDRFGKDERLQRADGSFDPLAAMALLQNDPELRAAFLNGGEIFGEKYGKAALGKGKAIPTIEGLITSAETFQSEQMSGSYRAIGGFDRGEATYDKLVGDIRSVTPTEQIRRLLQSETQISQAGNLSGISSVLRDELPKFEAEIGTTATGQRFNAISRELQSGFGTDPVAAIDTAQDQLRRVSRDLTATTEYRSAGVGAAPQAMPRRVSDRDRDQATVINRLVDRLEEIESLITVEVKVNNRPAEASVKTPPGPRKHSRLNSHSNAPAAPTGGRR